MMGGGSAPSICRPRIGTIVGDIDMWSECDVMFASVGRGASERVFGTSRLSCKTEKGVGTLISISLDSFTREGTFSVSSGRVSGVFDFLGDSGCFASSTFFVGGGVTTALATGDASSAVDDLAASFSFGYDISSSASCSTAGGEVVGSDMGDGVSILELSTGEG